MKPVAVYTHAACLRHDPGAGHPEHPGRLSHVLDALRAAFPNGELHWHEAPRASRHQLERVHESALVDAVHAAEPEEGHARLDADTAMSPGSLEAALRAAGAVVAAVDAVHAGPLRRAFCAVRPPGHHATPERAMGFCLFNNVAVGARHALHQHGIERLAIVDFDVHHGNGTQDAFAQDPRVLFVSSHQWPLYPGTGHPSERGVGNIVNGGLAPGSGSREFRALWREQLLPAIAAFQPQMLLVSAGFDAHRLDPLAGLNLDAADYAWLSAELCHLADKHARGRLVSTLEGGYSLTALRESAVAHVRALGG